EVERLLRRGIALQVADAGEDDAVIRLLFDGVVGREVEREAGGRIDVRPARLLREDRTARTGGADLVEVELGAISRAARLPRRGVDRLVEGEDERGRRL